MRKPILYYLIIIIICITLIPIDNYARGRHGTYILAGIAITKSGDTLKNINIIIYRNSLVDTIQTDAKGNYQYKINWYSSCPILTPFQRIYFNKMYNPKNIYFLYKGEKIKVKNKWRRFLKKKYYKPESQIKIKNLQF